MADLMTAPGPPCPSCPYRKDAPPGLWHESEYRKLPRYDEPTWNQPERVFGCHQADGTVCRGWLMAIDRAQSLALRARVGRDVDPAVLDYSTDVPCFSSGAEAAEAGIRPELPEGRAERMARKLIERRGAQPS